MRMENGINNEFFISYDVIFNSSLTLVKCYIFEHPHFFQFCFFNPGFCVYFQILLKV